MPIKDEWVTAALFAIAPKPATTPMFVSRRIDYEIVLYPHSGTPHSARKGGELLIQATTRMNLKTIT